jgi:UBX domain-containing protein 7
MMDEAIAQIVTITSAPPERAAQYLQLADGDLDSAVMLYFENNGADPSGGSSTENAPPLPAPAISSRPRPSGDAENPIDIDDTNISDDNDPEITGFQRPGTSSAQTRLRSQDATFDADAEYARMLQEEMYGGVGMETRGEDGELRAPIARQTETLLGPGADPLDDRDIPAHVMEQMSRIQNRRTQQGRCISSHKKLTY